MLTARVAVDDEELGAGELAEVARGELVVVRADVGREEVFDFSKVAGNVRGEAIDGEEAGEDAEFGGGFGGADAGGEGEQGEDRQGEKAASRWRCPPPSTRGGDVDQAGLG